MPKRKRTQEEDDEGEFTSPSKPSYVNKNINRNPKSPSVGLPASLQAGLTAKVDLQDIRKKLMDKSRTAAHPQAIVTDPIESKPYKVLISISLSSILSNQLFAFEMFRRLG